MNSSRLSDSSGARRAARGLFARIAIYALALGASVLASCKDEIAPPTLGKVEIQLASPVAGGIDGARIFLGDSLLVASVDRDRYEVFLPAGMHTLRVEKECCEILSEAARQVQIEPGHPTSLSWEIVPVQESAIEVVSSIHGAKIRLDGVDTGRTTPATLTCVLPGTHHVSVSLIGATAGADSTKTVEVGQTSVQASFDLSPVPQARVALMEVFTATYCRYCITADAVAETLWTRLGPENGYLEIQNHVYWGGQDSLATPTSLDRNTFYGDLEGHGMPVAMVSGTGLVRGAGSQFEEVLQTYMEKIDPIRTSASAIAFYWLAADREPGQRATGQARIMCLRDLPESNELQVIALSYKDGLETMGISAQGSREITTYRHVVREFKPLGNAHEMALDHRGDWIDVDVALDLSRDRRPGGSLWREDRMGLMIFVQNMRTKEILQVGHTALP